MNKISQSIFVIVFLLLFTFGFTQVTPLNPKTPKGKVIPLKVKKSKEKKIFAKGAVKIFNGNVDKARLAALRVAYAEAIQRGCGIEIGSLTMIRNVKYVSDIIASRSRGFIKEYKIISDGISEEVNSKYEVSIEAVVIKEGKSTEDEKDGLKLYLELLGNPKLLIILPEKNSSEIYNRPGSENKKKTIIDFKSGDTKLYVKQEDDKKISDGILNKRNINTDNLPRSLEYALAQNFSEYGYQVITSDDLLSGELCDSKDLAKAKAGMTSNAIKIARSVGADLAILGIVHLSSKKIKPAGVSFISVTGEISTKTLIVSSGRLIKAFHKSNRVVSPNRHKGYSDLIDKIAGNISDIVAWEIPQMLSNEHRELSLQINSISLKQTMELKKRFKEREEIEKVIISKLPTQNSPYAKFKLLSGYITFEPDELLEICSKALNSRLILNKSNKFEMELTL